MIRVPASQNCHVLQTGRICKALSVMFNLQYFTKEKIVLLLLPKTCGTDIMSELWSQSLQRHGWSEAGGKVMTWAGQGSEMPVARST